MVKRSCTHPRIYSCRGIRTAGSGQALLRHTIMALTAATFRS